MGNGGGDRTRRQAIDAIAHDARRWREFADEVGPLEGLVKGLDLTEGHLSHEVDAAGGVAAYAEFREKMARLLAEARTHFEDVADRLESVVRIYEESRDESIARSNRVDTRIQREGEVE